MAEKTYDRTTQDVGNILAMEHVNVTVPDQALALQFYVQTLGLTRDPYMMVGTENMWVNVGEQQFHLPTRAPQVLRGQIGLVVPDLDGLKRRLGTRATQALWYFVLLCRREWSRFSYLPVG